MPKEYRTIQEVAGPLMLVRGVENVAYDELGEIELASGEKRRCKVLEIDGGDALVQLFENSAGINLESSKVRFLGRSMACCSSAAVLSRLCREDWTLPNTNSAAAPSATTTTDTQTALGTFFKKESGWEPVSPFFWGEKMTTSSSALSAAESVSFAPHAEQNCALFFCSLPHFGQILGMAAKSSHVQKADCVTLSSILDTAYTRP